MCLWLPPESDSLFQVCRKLLHLEETKSCKYMSLMRLCILSNSRCNISVHTWNYRCAFGCRRRAILSSRCAPNRFSVSWSEAMSQIPVKDRYPFRKWTAGRTDIPDMDGCQDCRSVCLQDMIPYCSRKLHWPVRLIL